MYKKVNGKNNTSFLRRFLIDPTKNLIALFSRESARSSSHIYARTIAREMLYEESRNLKRGLEKNALAETIDYIEQNMLQVPILQSRWDVISFSVSMAAEGQGCFMEFGVAGGDSINYIAGKVDRKVYGFDSFDGLAENWGAENKAGDFKQDRLPSVKDNVFLIEGYFEKSLTSFLVANSIDKISFIHIDCDLYSSTKYVLETLSSKIEQGTIILFDEYFNFPGWRHHEFKAWQEFVKDKQIEYKYHCYCERGRQVVIEIL